jgi:hypothetical protein
MSPHNENNIILSLLLQNMNVKIFIIFIGVDQKKGIYFKGKSKYSIKKGRLCIEI